MTAFDKSKFTWDGMYLEYEGRFVARFKYVRSNAAGFRRFLIKNFTVEEYFARRDRDEQHILESKGYVPGHIRKWLIEAGLPPTPEGRAEFSRRQR
ncbi:MULTISPECIES: hypothetical protein [unclassified Bradyrhizobium]|uniref:hypothetical protein n=1 Tax=unclassified Bradyrhizobium TaxID=2631580 RepID=UPI001CD5231D|nr:MULTISPECIES: hypothetical protein [unclassified Bradyrhizobium]MCA1386125.1 hypothetical protein [Bradyrhizobium sp. BRP05]MCA1394207.1 hypothetical protein [Bradyrhizobium sp. IC3123]MCA1423666.1 hypothetical protein [Bradyrhizobium sp. BRP23]MCA1430678.1 hypothetical protein [Bradyrhizobium sp. NBAIM16]MCA1480300.1 hypothetical protein [Bradyrhizobium sp. NBAIM08]